MAVEISKNKSVDLGKGSVGKLLFQLALPAITAQIINVLYNMVDRMYIGRIEGVGAAALTGVGVTMPVITAISAFAMLVSMGGAPRASIMMGKKDNKAAEKILGNCVSALVVIAVILTAVMLIFGKDILMLFGASENTIGYGWDYLRIYSMGTIFVQLAMGLNMFITAQGFAKMSMLTVVMGAICNIVLDPIFIFGFGMGVKGAAIATVISQAISSIWVVYFLCSKKTVLKIKKTNLKISLKVLLPSLALGLSPFIMSFTESILTVCFNISLLKYGGDLAVGAMTILGSVMQFAMLPLQGLTQGAQPIVSYNYGAMNIDRIKKAFKYTLISSVVYSSMLWAISMFAPLIPISVFTNSQELKEFAVPALRVYMATSCVFGAQIACQQTLIAFGNAKTSVFLAVLRKIILLIPLIFILPIFVTDKTMGVFLAEPIADFIAVSVTVTVFTVTFKKLIKDMEMQKMKESY